MNKEARWIFPTLIAILLIVIFFIGLYRGNKSVKIIENIIDSVYDSNGTEMIYLGSSSCSNCDLAAQEMHTILGEYDFSYYYIDIDEVKSTSRKNKILTKLGLDIYEGFDFPVLLVYEDGKLKDTLSGLTGIDKIINFLKDNEIIDSESKSILKFVDIAGYNTLMSKSGLSIVGVTAYQSEEGLSFQDTMWTLAKEYDIDINMVYLSYMTEAEYENFLSVTNITDDDMDVPVLFIIENGTIKSKLGGLQTEDDYVAFFENFNIISK